MRSAFATLTIGCLLCAGCDKATTSKDSTKSAGTPSSTVSSDNKVESSTPSDGSRISLGPENAKIQFVGTHVGPKPDPNARTGGFERFAGHVEVDEKTKAPKSISIDIETGSLWTQQGGLTTHLNTPDFFDTREYPTAKFNSTSITPASGGDKYTITGDLTMLETTKSISFPATVAMGDAGLKLNASFTIDRTEFGMDRLQERVEKEVKLDVAIGEKTEPQKGPPGGGGGRRGGGNPAEFFKQRDTNGDGKLSGDEIAERMRPDLKEIDTDGDEAISLEEFQARAQRFGRQGGRQGRGEGKGPSEPPAPKE